MAAWSVASWHHALRRLGVALRDSSALIVHAHVPKVDLPIVTPQCRIRGGDIHLVLSAGKSAIEVEKLEPACRYVILSIYNRFRRPYTGYCERVAVLNWGGAEECSARSGACG